MTGLNLENLSVDEMYELLRQLEMLKEYERTHKNEYFSAYPYQQEFYEAGSKYKRRFLLAANRIG